MGKIKSKTMGPHIYGLTRKLNLYIMTDFLFLILQEKVIIYGKRINITQLINEL